MCIDAYVALLKKHIDTENNDLFPLAEARLDAKTDSDLFEAFERLDGASPNLGFVHNRIKQ
jgi:hemerythrin-like domain-containing protein